jgi:hypothetical protein
METMTPQQALAILDQAAALAPLPRREHVLVQQALAVLEAALAKAQAPDDAA